tara:strand:+ start:295 stop:486 length:192 start_codon:yes stop_codon:yes gene_type:complete
MKTNLDLPRMIRKDNQWISFSYYQGDVMKLGGEGSIGFSDRTEIMSEVIAKFQLENYLHNGWN